MISLPKHNKKGVGILSYSQISLFKRSKGDYWNQYILGRPFIPNEYTEFGNKVGNALEKNDFSKFTDKEQQVLRKVERLDLFEKFVQLKYEKYGFKVVGYIDTCASDYFKIIDYKTGSMGAHTQYLKSDYTQLVYYALSLRQMHGVTPLTAEVQFIERWGNPKFGERLKVGETKPRAINIDIGMERLKQVYWETIEVAKQISEFYQNNKPTDSEKLPTLE